jgi:hypothetical protein
LTVDDRLAERTHTGYSSFGAAKRDLGAAGPGMVWDHIVEQSQETKSGFSREEINDPCNMAAVPSWANQARANYYNSIRTFSEGDRLRNSPAGQPFEFQRESGLDILNKILRGESLP